MIIVESALTLIKISYFQLFVVAEANPVAIIFKIGVINWSSRRSILIKQYIVLNVNMAPDDI